MITFGMAGQAIASIFGIGVVGYVGESVLETIGQKHAGVAWKIVCMIGAAVVGMHFVSDGFNEVKSVIRQFHF